MSDIRYCPRCQARIKVNAKFCTRCGGRVALKVYENDYVLAHPQKQSKNKAGIVIGILVSLIIIAGAALVIPIACDSTWDEIIKTVTKAEDKDEGSTKKDKKRKNKNENDDDDDEDIDEAEINEADIYEAEDETDTADAEPNSEVDKQVFENTVPMVEPIGVMSWSNNYFCDSNSAYTFGMFDSYAEIVTPAFAVSDNSFFVSTVLMLSKSGQLYTDKSRVFDVKLYDAATDTYVHGYRGMYDNIEGGITFNVSNTGHLYYLRITTYLQDGEELFGHGHIYS